MISKIIAGCSARKSQDTTWHMNHGSAPVDGCLEQIDLVEGKAAHARSVPATVLKACVLSVLVLGFSSGIAKAQQTQEPMGESAPGRSGLKTWSIGVRGVHLYDLHSTRHETAMNRDVWGLNGAHTKVDIGVEGYLEKQFTPLLGLQGAYRWGKMSGANDAEYYRNEFWQVSGDLVLSLSNISRWRKTDRPWVIYTKTGVSRGRFMADRYLSVDGSSNGNQQSLYWGGRAGAGFRYRLTDYLRVELEGVYNVVYHDGFDGFDNGTGHNPYLSTGLGVAYTFGQSRKKPMYGVNFFSEDYWGVKEPTHQRDSALLQDHEALQTKVKSLEAQIAQLERELSALKTPPPPPPALQPKLSPVTVYFEVSSAALTREAKRTLRDAFTNRPHLPSSLTLTSYADATGASGFNDRLKQQRAEAVERFLRESTGYQGAITVRIAATEDVDRDNFLSRKVVITAE
jgi:outer membrane protein OmpA-like peptidoglycan-associated protein